MLKGAAQPIPAWFRLVVWDSLVGGLSPLIPIPVLDDAVLVRTRRQMVLRLCTQAGIVPTPWQVRLLAGGGRGVTLGGCAAKAVIYPIKKLFRKVLYFLAIKEAVDTFSLLFHQGYLLQLALERGALGEGGAISDEAAWAAGEAVLGTLGAVDTRPINRVVKGVARSSGRMVAATVRWLFSLARRRTPLESVQAKGADQERLAAASPAASALLDRLLEALWGEEEYRRHLREELLRRLEPQVNSHQR